LENSYYIGKCKPVYNLDLPAFVKQNKVLRFPVHMKTSHQSTKKCKYRSSEKNSNTYYKNKQNINPACACNIYLINSIILFYLSIFKLCT
jgi:hypothetical protein